MQFRIREGSGGTGQYRGGDGIVRELLFLDSMTASILSNRRRVPPPGLAGGEDGQRGRNYLRRSSGRIEELTATAEVELEPGDHFIIETPGGGGFGQVTRLDTKVAQNQPSD